MGALASGFSFRDSRSTGQPDRSPARAIKARHTGTRRNIVAFACVKQFDMVPGKIPRRDRGPATVSRNGLRMSRTTVILLFLALLLLAVGLHNQIGRAFPAWIFRAKTSQPSGTASSPPLGRVLWSADMETGDLSQWSVPDAPGGRNQGGGVFNSGFATASVDTVSFAHSGLHAAKLFVNALDTGDLPTSGTRLFRWLEPERYSELYYRVWFYFPQRYTPNGNPPWWNISQWKSKRASTNDPFLALNVGNRPDGAMYFYLYDKNASHSHGQSIKPGPIEVPKPSKHTAPLPCPQEIRTLDTATQSLHNHPSLSHVLYHAIQKFLAGPSRPLGFTNRLP